MYINRISFYNDYSNQQNFKSKGPKGFKPVVKKQTKTSLRNINNSLFGELDGETQVHVLNIHSNISKIKKLFATIASNSENFTNLKYKYPTLVNEKYSKGLTFDLGEEESNTLLTVSEGIRDKSRLRLIVTPEGGDSTHLLIDGMDKVVANLNKKYPYITPPKIRYMTSKQIKDFQVEKYVEKAYLKTTDFLSYVENFESSQKNKISYTKIKEIEQTSEEKGKAVFENLKTVFDNEPENLASSVEAKVSPQTNKVLSMSKKQDDGAVVTISKKISSIYKENLTYIQLKRVADTSEYEYINIDLETGEFLKSNPSTGKPTVLKNSVYPFSPSDVKKYNLNEKIYNWSKDFFKTNEDKGEPTVSSLNRKPMKPLIAIGSAGGVYEPKPQKQLSKLSDENTIISNTKVVEENFVENNKEIPSKKEILEKAKIDAKQMADIYFKTFSEEFKKNILENIEEFKLKIESLFKQ